ncbi:MAG: type IV pilus twitching motility protein PilT [Candidatus Alcyoniella australis]|nr:type IV pilus twitching motility protein PilT [Candidatus Alcyoniella australis]
MAKIDKLLGYMPTFKASDLHLSPGEPPIYRVHGDIRRAQDETLTSATIHEMLIEIMDDRRREIFERTHDLDMIYSIEQLARFRVNVLLQERGVSAVFRMINNEILTAEQLSLPQAVVRLSGLKRGLVVVTGPTGSGKSTTLAAIINEINSERQLHVLTIEDPIEYVHQNKKCLVTQRQVEDHTLGFPQALRAALREDPDVILVGEMRDVETIRLAITAAETGHLVLGTLHTASAAKTVDRIIDVFPENDKEMIRMMLSESLKGVLAQVLLKRIDGKGRVAAFEVLLGSTALSNLIRESKTYQIASLIQTSRSQGMQLLDQSLLDLVKRKIVAPEEAYDYATDKRAFGNI